MCQVEQGLGRRSSRCYYPDYLKLDELLSLQRPYSDGCVGSAHGFAHDEMLFIITHQTYELWFKQIIFEFESVHGIFSKAVIEEHDMAIVNERLSRVRNIQNLLLGALPVLETMTPMDFLEFRDYLMPASGFQSAQFRVIEVMMGLPFSREGRKYGSPQFFLSKFHPKDIERVVYWESQPSLVELTEKWLERLPLPNFDWLCQYKSAVYAMLESDEQTVRQVFGRSSTEGDEFGEDDDDEEEEAHPNGGCPFMGNSKQNGEDRLEQELKALRATRATFESLFHDEQHAEMVSRGVRRWSRTATLNALFIFLYRDLPLLQMPFQFLQNLLEIDNGFTQWRVAHAQMAQRMLGTKIGTGATSGSEYLTRAAKANRVFLDLHNLSTYLVPRGMLPELPGHIMKMLKFAPFPDVCDSG
ncbi:tryptophan 2,3-dioxygenase, putative [Perkinsus marinus ATCC 50983]|uniref:Tryptophan 2,3-dioxygenase n=1 Tax=Perkinsus marinus (strain ATCC 50983 / TXsc) TaxID=423536 RepID=C5LBZ1_PERM5|nr:tryptophan 2,3-dioxygenase, putative [Perkinsus marinus ATCC 50983]EER05474.1 tryptophan 2,3-dioxygenase, putative [Perkinsus marinus ATCC 50983]|eukprot:XP_002773658.1 tryptophan 2,3-dioxygenase, putative [Perkinsus marinus ATCC 50983]